MPGTPTTKYAIPTLAGSDLARDIDTLVNSSLSSIDSKMVGYSEGPLASRPVSTGGSPGVAGRQYRPTDRPGRIDVDNGTGWDSYSVGTRGKSVIATTESRTNTAYGLLTTPDRVQGVVLPTDGLIVVAYQATWQESVNDAARAAFFIGSNQQQIARTIGPVTVAAAKGNAGSPTPNTDGPLFTVPTGLAGTDSTAAYAGDATTGQAVGWAAPSASYLVRQEVGGSIVSPSSPQNMSVGGPCYIFAAAGTYDVSVQFKASSGSVTAKNRKLWVWTLAF